MNATSTARKPKGFWPGQVSWTAGAGFVATALLLAGCASSATGHSSGSLPKLHIGSGSGAVPGAVAAAAAPASAAAGAPDAVAPMPMIGRMSIFGGYVLAGPLPDQPTHAPIWQWTPGQASKDDVEHLASALGLAGTPQRHSYGWDLTGSTGDLRVSDQAGHPWSFNRAPASTCPDITPVDIDDPNGSVTGCAMSVPDSATPAAGPDDAATRAAAVSLLAALGVTGDEEVNVGSPSSELTVAPRVDGMQTQGIETTVDVDASGIAGATGTLDAPSAGDVYPLRTAKAAFDQLGDEPRPMIAQYCGPMPVHGPINYGSLNSAVAPVPSESPAGPGAPNYGGPDQTGPGLAGGVASPPVAIAVVSPPTTVVSAPPIDTSPIPCPTPQPVKITGATLGLQLTYGATDDGSAVLVPTWFFATADSTEAASVVAIAAEFLDGPAQPTDVATAGAASSSPGFQGAGGGTTGDTVVPPLPPTTPPSSG
jgi:hypothetical protein